MNGSSLNLETFRINSIPSTAYYVPEYISEEEEKDVIARIYESPKPKWTQLSNRRLQNWGGVPHHKGMVAESVPSWLCGYLDKIHQLNVMEGKKPNHILVNEYLPGQGIMPHLDGTLFYPTITTVSVGSHIVLKFLMPNEDGGAPADAKFSLLLEPRSLLVLQDQLFHNYLHCIEEVPEDLIDETVSNLALCKNKIDIGDKLLRDTRISLTIRHVPKTTSFKINIGNKR